MTRREAKRIAAFVAALVSDDDDDLPRVPVAVDTSTSASD
jgi:hypothetical protein